MFSKTGLAKLIDAAMLRGNATADDIRRLCANARKYHFAAVTVFPYWVTLAARELHGSDVKISTAIGLPFGSLSPLHKGAQVRQAIHDGAHAVEIIVNIGELVAENYDIIRKEIHEVVNAAKMRALTQDGGEAAVMINVETAMTTPRSTTPGVRHRRGIPRRFYYHQYRLWQSRRHRGRRAWRCAKWPTMISASKRPAEYAPWNRRAR